MDIFWVSEVLEGEVRIEGLEVKHITRSLRKKIGDQILCTDGHGQLLTCEISSIGKNELTARIIEKQLQNSPPYRLHVAIAPLKNTSRFENFVEKAVEIGIFGIYPLLTKYTEKKNIRLDRIDRIVEAACKQSMQLHKPHLHDIQTFQEFIHATANCEHKFIAYVEEKTSLLSQKYRGENEVYILVGPEGGFTEDEVSLAKSAGWEPVSLGSSRLRTETAGIVTTQIIKTIHEITH